MKKILYILLSAFFAAACTEQPVPVVDEMGEDTGARTTFYFNPVVDCETVGTKALGEEPEIHNIYVAVFDGQGYKLSEYVEATPCTYADEDETVFSYSVSLKVSSSKRVLHFIANGPSSLPYGKETEVIGALYTSLDANGTDEFDTAYWQRVVLEDGVPETPVEGSPDYASKKAAYDRTKNALNNVTLIRNYSKITLKKNDDLTNFDVLGFWFVNYPNQGTVAPYNRNTKSFMSNYASFQNIADIESNVEGGGNYQGFALATTQFITDPFDNAHLHAASSGVATGYVYEREKVLESPMYIIVKAQYSGSDNPSGYDYYKVALQDGSGNFYAMLRNFNYLVRIEDVARKGMNTPEEAMASAPTGDISLNVEYNELKSISDGNARITVSETVIMLAGEVGTTLNYDDFWFMYEPDVVAHAGAACNDTTVSHEAPFVEILEDYEVGVSGPVFQSIELDADNTGVHRYIHFTTVPVSPIKRTQSILLTGKEWNGTCYETISRQVTFYLRETLDLNVSCGPNTDMNGYGTVGVGKNHKVIVYISMESDLPSQMFPLSFDIEAQNLTLSPDNAYASQQELPVKDGYSEIPGRGTIPSYWYEKTITWEDYCAAPVVNAAKSIPCYFVTNIANSATQIYVTPKTTYFAQGSTQLYNHSMSEFTTVTANRSNLVLGDPVNNNMTVSFTMPVLPEDGKVYVHMSKLEPVADSDVLTYVRTEEVDGATFEVYEMEVDNLSESFNVCGFDEGTGKIFLSAYMYVNSTILDASVRQNGIQIYYDSQKDNPSADDFVTSLSVTYTSDGSPVVGQSCKLTVYISEDVNSSNVQIDGSTVTGKKTGSITVGGVTYWGYYLENYAVGTVAGTKSIPVTVSGVSAGSAHLPVYGISIGNEVTTTNSGSFNTSAYYVFKNHGTNRFVVSPGTNNTRLSLATRSESQYSTDMLWKFGSTQSTSTILAAEMSSSGFYMGHTGDYEPRLNDPSTITLNYASGKGMSIYRSRSGTNYYFYDNSGTSASNTSLPGTNNNNYYWHVYKVNFELPTE